MAKLVSIILLSASFFFTGKVEREESQQNWVLSFAFSNLPVPKITHQVIQFFNNYQGILKQKQEISSSSVLRQVHMEITILYSLGMMFFLQTKKIHLEELAWVFWIGAFCLHSYTALLLSNSALFEVSLYLDWAAVLLGIFLFLLFKNKNLLFLSVLASIIFFTILSIDDAQSKINLQAFLLNKSAWIFFHDLIKTAGFSLLLLAAGISHVILMTNNKLNFVLQHCVYWGVLCMGISILTWSFQDPGVLLSLCFYAGIIHLSNHQKYQDDVLAIGACAGLFILGWEWRKDLVFFNLNFEKTTHCYPGFILLETFFIAALLIRKRWRSEKSLSKQ